LKTLAIDTSAGTSIAVLDRDLVLAEVNYLENMTHAERIGAAIKEVLASADLKPVGIDRVVVGLGPGPFTGLRVGIAAAKFFAIGSGAEIVGVCSLDAIAFDFFKQYAAAILLVTTDARRKELFWATYTGVTNGIPNRDFGPAVNKPEDIPTSGLLTTDLVVSAAALGQIAFNQGAKAQTEITPIYLREPDATPGKGKKVSG